MFLEVNKTQGIKMLRRNFLKVGALAAASAVVIPQLNATDFRATKPAAW